MQRSYQLWRWPPGIILSVLVLLTLSACEPDSTVEYRNETSQRVAVYNEGRFQFTIEPHETIRAATREKYWLPNVKIVSEDGQVLLEDHITWDEVCDLGRKIVIADPSATPTPSPSG